MFFSKSTASTDRIYDIANLLTKYFSEGKKDLKDKSFRPDSSDNKILTSKLELNEQFCGS